MKTNREKCIEMWEWIAGQVDECKKCYYQIAAHNNEKSCLLSVLIPKDIFNREDYATDCE